MAGGKASTSLGSAHVSFTADFSHLTQGIQQAVKMAQTGSKEIRAQFSEVERAAKRAGKAFSNSFSTEATRTTRSVNRVRKSFGELSKTATKTGTSITSSLSKSLGRVTTEAAKTSSSVASSFGKLSSAANKTGASVSSSFLSSFGSVTASAAKMAEAVSSSFGRITSTALKSSATTASTFTSSLGRIARSAVGTGTSIATAFVGGTRMALASWMDFHRTFISTLSMIRMRLVFFKLDLEFMTTGLRRLGIGTVGALGGMAAAAVSFEQSFVMVRRVVQASESEFEQLEKNVRALSKEIPISANELAGIMGVAGRLGIRGVDNLTSFTETIAKLQMTTDIVGEEAAASLARVMVVMDEAPGNIDRVGASIVDLGNNFAATEMQIINMAMRLAGAARVVRMSIADVLGLSTALAQAGVRADMGGTAMSRVMINMSQAVAEGTEQLQTFARVAGVSARAFADQFRNDPVRAIEAFVLGLRRLDESGQNVFAVLEEVGMTEVRTRDSLLRLVGAADNMSAAVDRSNRAWYENLALNEEVAEALNTTAAQFGLLWNEIVDVARQIGDQLQPVMRNLLDVARGLVSILETLTDEQKRNIAQWTIMVGTIAGVGMAFMTVVHILMTTALSLVLAFQLLTMLTGPTFLGFMGIILVLGLLKRAFQEDWGGIGNHFLSFLESVKKAYDALDVQSVVDEIKSSIETIRSIWNNDELMFGEKIIETGSVIVQLGSFMWEWAGQAYETIVEALLAAWGMEDEEIESLTLPEKTIASVRLAVGKVVGVLESIGSWWLKTTVSLVRKAVEMVGLDPDENALVAMVEKIKKWWEDEEVTLPEKVLGVAGLTLTGIVIRNTARQLATWIGASISTRLFMGAAAGFGATAIKIVLPAVAIAGLGVVFMEEEAQKEFREALQKSMDGLKEDMDETWSGFWEDLRKSGETALKEGRFFDPLTLIVGNLRDTARALNKAILPISEFLHKQIAENFDVDLKEAFRRAIEGGELDIDPRAAAAFDSFIELGEAIGELLMESILLAFNLAYLIVQIFSVPISGALGAVAEVGAQLGGEMVDAFHKAWDKYVENTFKPWFRGTFLYRVLTFLGIVDPIDPVDTGEVESESLSGTRVPSTITPELQRYVAKMVEDLEFHIELIEQELTFTSDFDRRMELAEQISEIRSELTRLQDAMDRGDVAEILGIPVPSGTSSSDFEVDPLPFIDPGPHVFPGLKGDDDSVRLFQDALANLVEDSMESVTLRAELTKEEIDLIARMVVAEAEGEPFEGMVAVAEVILNRLDHPSFPLSSQQPNTVEGILFDPWQFEPVATGRFNAIEANTEALEAVEQALRGTNFAEGALFFFNPDIVAQRNPLHWMLSDLFTTHTEIGRHRFGTETRLLGPGRQHGAIMPGLAGADQFPVKVAPGEAIVPSQAVRRGWPGVLAWFQSKGVPGFQQGLAPTGIPEIDDKVLPTWDAAQAMRESVEKMAETLMKGLENTFSWLGGIFIGAIEFLVQVLEKLFPEQAEEFRGVIEKLAGLWEELWVRPEAPTPEPTATLVLPETPETPRMMDLFPLEMPEIPEGWRRLADIANYIAMQEEIARVTGEEFDALNTEMRLLRDAIREMADAAGEVPEEAQPLIDRLNDLTREHEALVFTESAVREALGAFGKNLGDVGRVLVSHLRFQAGSGLSGFSFDTSGFAISAIGMAVDALFGASDSLDGSAAAIDRAAQALESASRSWRQALSEGQFHELVTTTPEDQIRELQKARKDAEGQIEIIEKRWLQIWKASAHEAQKSQLRDLIQEIDKEVRNLQENWETELQNRLNELLGITTRGLQSAVSGAFSAATAEEFAENMESSLKGRIRNAFITGFLESSFMASLFEDLQDEIRETLTGVDSLFDLTESDLERIGDLVGQLVGEGTAIWEFMDQFELLTETTKDLNTQFGRLGNVPRIFRVALERFRVADFTNLPSLNTEGYITRSGVAMVHAGEVVAKAERLQGNGEGVSVTVHVHGDGWDSERLRTTIRREVSNAVRDANSARYGIAGVGV